MKQEEDESKSKYIELQMLNQQIKQGQQQLQQLEMQIMELKRVMEDLNDIKNTKKGTEIFTPVTAGIFAKAQMGDTDELLVNVGANVAVKKTIEGSKDLINKQVMEIAKLRDQMLSQIRLMDTQAVAIEEEIIKSNITKAKE